MRNLFSKDSLIGLVIIAAFFLVLLAGCDARPTAQEKTGIATLDLSTTERAQAFGLIKGSLKAKDQTQQAALGKYLDLHSSGLNAEAKAMQDFNTAIKNGARAGEAFKSAMSNEVDTAVARAANWEYFKTLIDATPEQQAFIDTHSKVLKDIADNLAKMKAQLADAPKKAPAVPAPAPAPKPAQ